MFSHLVTFQLPQQKYVIPTSLYIVQSLLHSVCIHVEYNPSFHGHGHEIGSSKSTFFIYSFTWEPYSATYQPFGCHPRVPMRRILVFDEQKDIPNLVLFPNQDPIELPRIVFPKTILVMGVRIIFALEELRDLQCSPRI